MVSAGDYAEAAGIVALDEGVLVGLGFALAATAAPSPLAVIVPGVCQAFIAVWADPFPWTRVSGRWEDMRQVIRVAAADATTVARNITQDAWTDDGAVEFKKYVGHLADILAAFADLTDTTAQRCNDLFTGFLDEQIGFILAVGSAIAECIVLSMTPDPASQVIFKSIAVGVFLSLVSGIIMMAYAYMDKISGAAQQLQGKYDTLAGLLSNHAGKLDANTAQLDPDRLKVIADPKEWKLPEIPPQLLT